MNNTPIAACVVSNYYLDCDYIEEWCEHYYNIGIDVIYILEDVNGRTERFADMPYITEKLEAGKMIIEEIKHQNQYLTYPEFYQKHKNEFSWCCIFDSDEFLFLNKHSNIKEFLNDPVFIDTDVITVNWRWFGDNGNIYKTDGKVVDRFPKPAEDQSSIETKVIVKGGLQKTDFMIGHCCIANNNPCRTKFCDGSPYTRMNPFHEVNYEYAALNHYYTKSTEEFIKRKSLGRLDIITQSYKTAFIGFEKTYWKYCERTPEKENMFNEAMKNF